MEGLIILLIILSLLFIIEYKSINTLANFIGIIIILAIILALNNCDYLSFILILVQISALTILFGFIIMLFPKNNTIPQSIGSTNILNSIRYKVEFNKGYKYIIYTIILYIVIKFQPEGFINLYYNQFSDNFNLYYNQFSDNFNLLNISNTQNNFISKIGVILYNSKSYVIVFIVLIIFLLFAIIALFYLLIPTI